MRDNKFWYDKECENEKMNDLEKDLSYKAKGINLWDQSVCSMLYADDLILLAESASDLQIQMDLLSEYANSGI